MSDADEARYGAMVEFLGTFPTLSGSPPQDISELSDGVALFEALSEMYVIFKCSIQHWKNLCEYR